MSFKFMKLCVDWDGEKYNSRLELGDTSTSPDTPVDIRFKVPGYIENVHTIFFQDYSSGSNVPRIYGDATDLVFFDSHITGGKTLSELAASGLPSGVQGDVLYHSGAEWVKLGASTSGNVLTTQGASANPVWAAGGGESLWEDDVDYAWLTTSKHINLQDKSIIGIQSLKSFDTDGIRHHDSSDASAFTIAPIVSTVTYAWRAWADGRMEGNDIIMGTGKITGLAAGTVSGDSVALDGDGYVPILDLPLGGTGVRGDLLVGTNAGCSTLTVGANDLVLTADSTQTLGVRWGVAGGGEGLWEVDGTETQLIAADEIDMQYYSIFNVDEMHIEKDTLGNPGYLRFRESGADRVTMFYDFSNDKFQMLVYEGTYKPFQLDCSELDLNQADIVLDGGHKVKGLAAASGSGEAVRYDEFNTHENATTGIHGVGANTIEHTGHKGAANGYCDLDTDSRVPNNRYMLTTKGYLLVGATATTCNTLAVGGTNGHVLMVDNAQTLGVKWAAAGAATDHSALSNLGFASSGHSGFMASTATSNLNMNGYDIIGCDDASFDDISVDDITLDGALSTINVNSGVLTNVQDITMNGSTSFLNDVGVIDFYARAAPSALGGRLYFSSSDFKFHYYTGAQWKTIATE